MKNADKKPKQQTKLPNPNSKDMSVVIQNHLLAEVEKLSNKYENGITVTEVVRGLGMMIVGYGNVMIDYETEMDNKAKEFSTDKNVN